MSKKNYVIHPIPLLRHSMPYARMLSHTSYGQSFDMNNYIWYIEGTKQNVIIDAGMKVETNKSYGYESEEIQTLEQGLKSVGLTAKEVDVVIVTHLHIDHMDFAHEFSNARFVVQREELEFALNPHPMYSSTYPPAVTKGFDFEVVDEDTTFEDGINLIFTPGHSAGGQSVAINTKDGLAIITGFCCIQANFEPLPPDAHQWGPPASMKRAFTVPGMHINPMQAYDSMLKVIKLADIVIPIHEQKLKLKASRKKANQFEPVLNPDG